MIKVPTIVPYLCISINSLLHFTYLCVVYIKYVFLSPITYKIHVIAEITYENHKFIHIWILQNMYGGKTSVDSSNQDEGSFNHRFIKFIQVSICLYLRVST